jgi:hypothetical protein
VGELRVAFDKKAEELGAVGAKLSMRNQEY